MPNRISNQLLTKNFVADLRSNIRQLAKVQRQIATGRVVNTPEDDPKQIATILLFDKQIDRINQHRRNSEMSRDFLDNSESALQVLSADIQRARELSVRVANGTMGAEDRQAVREEIFQLLDDAVAVGNQQIAGQYLFSGTRTTVRPFSLDTATLDVAYNGNSESILREIDSGQNLEVNIPGDDGAGTGTFQTIFKGLKTVLSAIDSNDAETLGNAALEDMDDALNAVSQARTVLGAKSNRIMNNVDRLSDVQIRTMQFRSELQDLDVADGVTRLNIAETTYRAALAVGARVIQPTLLDFLR